MNIDVLFDGEIEVHRVAEVLDELGHVGRVETIRHWNHSQQARLFEAVKDFRPLTLSHFVPDSAPPMSEVVHWGKNSLPMFTRFKKTFCRPMNTNEELWGYNDVRENFYGPFTGPGYFVMHAPDRAAALPGELDLDYRKIPTSKPDSWPRIIPNEARLGRIVYAGMIDVMRGVSNHVSVGRAFRRGRFVDAYFVLCREDPKPS